MNINQALWECFLDYFDWGFRTVYDKAINGESKRAVRTRFKVFIVPF